MYNGNCTKIAFKCEKQLGFLEMKKSSSKYSLSVSTKVIFFIIFALNSTQTYYYIVHNIL